MPEKIEVLVREIQGYSLICTDATLIDGADNIVVSSFHKFSGRVQPMTNKFEYLVFGNFVTGCTAMFTNDLKSRALPIPDVFSFHDHWLGIIATQEKGIRYLSEKLVCYRQHEKNVSGAGMKISLLSFLSTAITRKENIKNDYVLKNKRITYLLTNQIYSDANEKNFLEDAFDYTNLFIGNRGKFRSLYFALKYRNKIPQMGSQWIGYLKLIYLSVKYLRACFIQLKRD